MTILGDARAEMIALDISIEEPLRT